MYSFTNHFSQSSLRERVGMMNRQQSGYIALGRYVVWVMLIGMMVLACRHKTGDDKFVMRRAHSTFPQSNITRQLAAELDQDGMPWVRQSSLYDDEYAQARTTVINGRRVAVILGQNFPTILCIRNDKLALKLPDGQKVKAFINGQEAKSPEQSLSALRFEEIDDLFIYHKLDDAPNSDTYPESYRIFISTTHKTPVLNQTRSSWKNYLKAAAVSDYPLGKFSTFSMNKLLEATFFSNKLAFVSRTKDDYLVLHKEYSQDIDLFINGLSVKQKDIEGVHVREVDRLYAGERSFEEWVDGSNRKSRFVLYIQTTPKRAKRDSSYYVFSPFYSGDF
jgi:hypothetical protein